MKEHARAKGIVAPQKKETAPAKQPARGKHHEPVANPGENTMPPWVGWVCGIVVVLLVVWIVFPIIRAMTGAMGGGGYGYGGRPGNGGAGRFTGGPAAALRRIGRGDVCRPPSRGHAT